MFAVMVVKRRGLTLSGHREVYINLAPTTVTSPYR
jgi:hypothetical protein